MKHYILWQTFVRIEVYEVLADAYSRDTTFERGFHNLNPVGGGGTENIHCLPSCMCGVACPSLAQIVLLRAVRTIQYQRNICFLPHLVQEGKKCSVHILNGAGRNTLLELAR